ncbi:MAG: OsmC family protein [Woeseiaceae bacterium]
MSNSDVHGALDKLTRILIDQPEKARSKNAAALACLREGLKCHVTGPNGEHVETDMPPTMGGTAAAPNPGWLFRASIASCGATLIAMRAAQLGIGLQKLEVSVTSESDHRGILGLDKRVSAAIEELRIHVKIAADGATRAQLLELASWAEEHSPVGCTVRQGARSIMDVELAPAPA